MDKPITVADAIVSRRILFLFVGAVVLVAQLLPGRAEAQLFGQRTLGQSLSRRPRPGLSQGQESVGSLQGNERFMRGSRGARDVVGTGARGRGGFVGVDQATSRTQVRSAVQGLQETRSARTSINQRLRRVRKGEMYHPKLVLGFEPPPSTAQGLAPSLLLEHLTRALFGDSTGSLEVLVEGRTALLQGVVDSARQRDLAELLVLFEPGISVVRNELEVSGPPSSPPPSAEPVSSSPGRAGAGPRFE